MSVAVYSSSLLLLTHRSLPLLGALGIVFYLGMMGLGGGGGGGSAKAFNPYTM
jgi:hypothetical protein